MSESSTNLLPIHLPHHPAPTTTDETAAATDSEPPHKKRRGLAGSIVSTAVSAALIGTAVGLTVYRLWRDRGKEGQIANSAHNATDSDSDQPPPPPYDEAVGSRITQHPTVPLSSSSSTSTSTTTTQRVVPTTPGTPTPHTRFGSGTGTAKGRKKHTVTVRRAKRNTPRQGYVSAFGSPRARGSTSAGARGGEFDFGYDYAGREDAGEGRTEVEDKMDWMGDKLSQLIEQGRRALQTEVVVMSEAREDEVDDGAGGWVEDDNDDDDEGVDSDADSMRGYGAGAGGGRRRAGSVRSLRSLRSKATVTPRKTDGLGLGISVPSSSSMAAAAPFYTASFERPPVHGHTRGVSHESGLGFGLSTPGGQGGFGVTEEESGAWESPEIRASMERARARVLAARRGGGGV
ncbi:hypothetical protein JR316_0008372 [Psilocybe cubensis]|nr:hypothetical protein JR316_0008372 [Psilocybe cubensis]KAH9479777.1 hypothetical protein JR316_0008372 [Psilocybe cubensis]